MTTLDYDQIDGKLTDKAINVLTSACAKMHEIGVDTEALANAAMTLTLRLGSAAHGEQETARWLRCTADAIDDYLADDNGGTIQ